MNVAVISLGCDKNRVDTERMLYRISKGGHGICEVQDADAVIINTCAFIESAKQESIDTILSCAEYKKTGKLLKLIVCGCMPQRYLQELQKELPEVDAFLGVNDYESILDVLSGKKNCCVSDNFTENFASQENYGRLLTTYPHLAYLKIADGCDNKCTFCAIPAIRGKYRSRNIDELTAEASCLVKDGVKELVLVAQDVTRYGLDCGTNLVELLKRLTKLPAFIRLMYCYPEMVTDELIDLIASDNNILPYIDMPIQHSSDRILKLMNRRTTGSEIEKKVNKLHDKSIIVRTSLMVGFPSETDEEFNELCDFMRRTLIEYAGVFTYSKEDGTAASKMKGQIVKQTKLMRQNLLRGICAASTKIFNEGFLGKKISVIYEDVDDEKQLFVGRAPFQAPDVDGRVYFTGNDLNVGEVYTVLIKSSDSFDLYGEAVS